MKKDSGQKKSNVKNPEVEVLRSQLARALADYDNLKKRIETEKETIFQTASYRVLVRLLPIMDILEDAYRHNPDQGLAIAITEFKRGLIEENLQEIRPKTGEKFDEQLHEVIQVIEGDKDGKISELVLAGWRYVDGPVIRHAKVKVTKVKKAS